MRFLMKVSIPVETGNDAARGGRLGGQIKEILDDLKPEAVYFTEEHGERTGILIVDLPEAYHIPKLAEPWFLAFNAKVHFHPVMLPEDLMRAGPDIEAVVKKFG